MAEFDTRLLKRQRNRAKTLMEEYLQCRLLGHQWSIDPGADTRTSIGVGIGFECQRCHCQRLDVIGPRYGELLKRKYNHPTDYITSLDEQGERAYSAAALRAELLARLAAPEA